MRDIKIFTELEEGTCLEGQATIALDNAGEAQCAGLLSHYFVGCGCFLVWDFFVQQLLGHFVNHHYIIDLVHFEQVHAPHFSYNQAV